LKFSGEKLKFAGEHHGREAIAQMQYKSQLFAGNSTTTTKKRVFYLWQTARL